MIVHNGTTWISVAGVTDHGGLTGLGDDDHTIYILVDGSRTFTGDVAIENSIPYLQLKGTEGSGGIYAIKENAGVFYISKNTGTIAVPVWVDLVSVSSAGVITAIADNIVGYDTGNSMEVSLKAHASRHKMAGTDPINYLQLGGYVGTGCPQTSNVYIGLALFPIYAPSGTKTYYIKSNMWDAGGGGVGVSARFSILGESAASAALDTLSTASATIVSGSFSSTGAGWQTLYIEVKTNDINANGRIETFYVYTN